MPAGVCPRTTRHRGRPSRAKLWVISPSAPALPGEPQTSPHPWVLDPAHTPGQAAPSLPSSGSPGTPAPALMSSRAPHVSSSLHTYPPHALTSPCARTSLPTSQGLGNSPCHLSWPSGFPSPTIFVPPPPALWEENKPPAASSCRLLLNPFPPASLLRKPVPWKGPPSSRWQPCFGLTATDSVLERNKKKEK